MKIKHSKLLLGLVMMAFLTSSSYAFIDPEDCFLTPTCQEHIRERQEVINYFARMDKESATASEWMVMMLAARNLIGCLEKCYRSAEPVCELYLGEIMQAWAELEDDQAGARRAAKQADPSRIEEINKLTGDLWRMTDFARVDLPKMGITIKGDINSCANIEGLE